MKVMFNVRNALNSVSWDLIRKNSKRKSREAGTILLIRHNLERKKIEVGWKLVGN